MRTRRLAVCLLLAVLGCGASAASASASSTLVLTLPGDAHANQSSTITASGNLDDASYIIVDVERNGTTCTGNSPPPSGVTRLGVESKDAPGPYTQDFTFHPTLAGTYHVCGYVISKSGGPGYTAESSVAVGAAQASVTTTSADRISGTIATLRGGVNAPEATDWHFEYGTSTSYGQTTTSRTMPPNAPNGAAAPDVVLSPSTTYHYRTVATNSGGTVNGGDASFTTAPATTLAMAFSSTYFVDENWPLSMSGSAGSPSYFAIYLERNGTSCAATIDEESARPAATLATNGTLGAGPYSLGSPMSVPRQDPGTYRACAYVVPSDRHSHTEASASSTVTVVHHACPGIDFSVSADPTQASTTGELDVVLPADATTANFVQVENSDGGSEGVGPDGGEEFPGEHRFETGGPQTVHATLSYKKTIKPSFDHPVTVTFAVTYSVRSDYRQCILPDGRVLDGGNATASYTTPPQTVTVTFRNHGTPPPDPTFYDETGGEGAGEAAYIVTTALASALKPTGPAAKIGAILKRGSYSAKTKAPGAGKLAAVWYFVPKGAVVPKGAHASGKPKPVVVASGSRTVTKAGKTVLKLRLTKKGKAKLKKSKSIKLTAKGSFTPKGGAKLTTNKAIKLKR